MLVCHCRAVSDQVLRAYILAGVRHERDLVLRSGAAGRCGGCLRDVRQLLAQYADIEPREAAAS
jgi:bacterioferritin-associated ferredoxin